MNAIPSNMIEMEKNNTEVVHDVEEGMVELGTVVADTKGAWLGNNIDSGQGFQFN